ncbi:hypothetical protein PTTG_10029 [Puccinia triticina 1-1 BBBD Race 1]|uniref:Prolyl endopeptidase n=2 Tax=Puccinia triticina TaxID=208348 RepID=A0A180G1Q4_PUCT1|nr:uncharacterized protein PtA15_9A582 [Puccinia triticina]OAV86379.1 hypothetical protein PTTG_10029 [Puccinia triticina 1-1 BBBD Race 1]WAQ88455.1 hypothetical protein PtA15_9A582 [Puccinia triticina]
MLLVTKFVAFLRFHIPIQRTFDSPESRVLFPNHPDTCPITHYPKHWDPKATPYPQVRRDSNSSDVFQSKQNGPVTVPDPYSWLHKPPNQSKETKQFVTRQQSFTKDYLRKYSHRHSLHRTLKKSWNYAKIGCPTLQPDGYYYFYFNPGLESQYILYRVKKGEEEEAYKRANDPKQPVGELFLDPNLFSVDGTAELASSATSKSGIYMAYEVSRSGSDSHTIYVRRTDCPHTKTAADGGKRGEDPGRMKDTIENVQLSTTSWMKDESGFFYSRYPIQQPKASRPGEKLQEEVKVDAGTDTKAELNHMVSFHRLGEPQSQDLLIFADPANPSYRWGAEVSGDGKYLILSGGRDGDNGNRVWVADLTTQPLSSEMKWQKVVNGFGSLYTYVTNDDSQLYFHTNKDAPNNKVVTYDLSKPEEGFTELIPEDPSAVLAAVYPINHNLVILGYSRDVKDETYLHVLKSGKRIKRIGEELIGTFEGFSGGRKDNEFFLYITSFMSPATVYRYRFEPQEDQTLVQFSNTPIPSLNPDDFVSKQVFYESKDGTKVPMFIVHKKDFKQDGTAPAIQYGYGGFGNPITPFFSSPFLIFVAHYGGVIAVPNIRGGGEYGERWHLAGSLEKKQNVFDDFQYATEYLTANRYVAPDKVTIMGGSNGGLLVAACVNQAPELYGAAIADAGVLDMLRFQRFTIGRSWVSEFGNPEDPEAFDYLIKYSPLHNINPGAQYPALMLLTADHDDRVVPLHSFKYAAAVQHALPMNKQPCLLRVESNAGHGAGMNTDMAIDSMVDQLSFIALSLGLEWKEYDGKKTS